MDTQFSIGSYRLRTDVLLAGLGLGAALYLWLVDCWFTVEVDDEEDGSTKPAY